MALLTRNNNVSECNQAIKELQEEVKALRQENQSLRASIAELFLRLEDIDKNTKVAPRPKKKQGLQHQLSSKPPCPTRNEVCPSSTDDPTSSTASSSTIQQANHRDEIAFHSCSEDDVSLEEADFKTVEPNRNSQKHPSFSEKFRKRSVFIYGVPECASTIGKERLAADTEHVRRFMQPMLQTCNELNVFRLMRIGKQITGAERPRPIRLVLENEAAVERFLQNAPRIVEVFPHLNFRKEYSMEERIKWRTRKAQQQKTRGLLWQTPLTITLMDTTQA